MIWDGSIISSKTTNLKALNKRRKLFNQSVRRRVKLIP